MCISTVLPLAEGGLGDSEFNSSARLTNIRLVCLLQLGTFNHDIFIYNIFLRCLFALALNVPLEGEVDDIFPSSLFVTILKEKVAPKRVYCLSTLIRTLH